ncbi:MFS transporter [Streptomyces sp. NBC_01390]|uniref:MFS transporter n=1 Tax=Streptomyces sp. NBC_01390 TaxID=2903850 RepID=UPI003249E591
MTRGPSGPTPDAGWRTPEQWSPGRWSPGQWGLLIVLAGNMLIDALEVSVVIVALPSVGQDLGLSLTGLQWLVSGFALGFGGLLLFGARVVELLGRRRIYLAALVAFAAASVVSGLTSEPWLLVAMRFVKGFCAALTAPTGLAIIAAAFREGPDRHRAVSVYAFFGAAGFTSGLLLSGLLTGAGWRWAFLFPAPVVLVLFAFAVRLVPADEPRPSAPRSFDVAGAASFAGLLLTLVYGTVTAAQVGWSAPRTIVLIALAALLAVAFVAAERCALRPLVRLDVLRNATLVRSMVGAAALNGSYLGLLLLATVRLQTYHGWSPWQTALAFLPASAPVAVTALVTGRLVSRFGTARLIALGALCPPVACLLYLLRASGPTVRYTTDVLPSMLLMGAGFVLAFAALNMQATSRVAAPDRQAAIGLYQTAVQVAAALVPAMVAAVAVSGAGDRAAVVVVLAVALLGLVPSAAKGETNKEQQKQ